MMTVLVMGMVVLEEGGLMVAAERCTLGQHREMQVGFFSLKPKFTNTAHFL